MEKYEVINNLLKNGYYLTKADEFDQITFRKTVWYGDDVVITAIEMFMNPNPIMYVDRWKETNGEKENIFNSSFDIGRINLNNAELTNLVNYTSVVL